MRENPFGKGVCAGCGSIYQRTGIRQRRCRPCGLSHKKQHASDNAKRWRQENIERIRERDRERNKKRAEENRRRAREWAKANPDKVKEQARRTYLANTERAKAKAKQWAQQNKERRRKISRESAARRRAENPSLFSERKRQLMGSPINRLTHNISELVRRALAGNKQSRRWETLVGYSVQDLRRHLERQFVGGMSWDNYGRWHVDHIVPVASFSFSDHDDDEFRRCWAMSNLRPLWASENSSKNAKRIYLL